MKIVVASDSFKGSIDSIKIGNIVEEVVASMFNNCETVKIPMADGGEGTVDALIEAMNGKKVKCMVKNPLHKEIEAEYGVFGDVAIIEMASASGITLVSDSERDIMKQSTYGTGEMLLDAIENGYNNIYMGIGGSATNDGGIGFAAAMGVIFLDKDDNKLEAIPLNLDKIASIDTSHINSKLSRAKITIMSDVSNPLLGELGATNVFGKQKGADEETRLILEKGMANYIDVAEKALNKEVRDIKGAGAAGGLGAGLQLFANVQMSSGVDTILELLKFKRHLNGASLVITGEGMMDSQSVFGKVASGVGRMCKSEKIPCIAIVGSMGEGAEEMLEHGICSIIPIVNSIMPLSEAIENAEELYKSALKRSLNLIKIGMEYK